MIPLKLQLKNFLSYGSDLQEIDFGSYNLICLSGKNGHGKSALLDAMTWALWGQARKVSATSKPDEGLLRLGQRQMIVIFDFFFNGNRYRVRREFTSAYGKNYAYLDFAMFGPESDNLSDEDLAKSGAIALTGKTIRETQAKVESILGLDFDAFINSAFLKQGQSNEFSKKSPKERKQILANILGLNRFENLKKAALEKSKQVSSEKDGFLKVVEHIENELKALPEINLQLIEVENNFKEFLDREAEVKNLIDKSLEKQEILNKKNNKFEILKSKLNQIEESFLELKNKFIELIGQWRSVHKQNIEFANFDNIEKRKKEIKSKLDLIQEKFHTLYLLKEKYSLSKEVLTKKIQEHQIYYSDLISKEKFKLEKNNLQKVNLKKEIDKIGLELSKSANKIKNLKSENLNLDKEVSLFKNNLETRFEKRKEFYHTLVANGNSIKDFLNNVSSKQKMISDKTNPSCPLCLQNLSISRKDYLQKQFVTEESVLTHKLNRIKLVIPKLKDYLLEAHSKVKKLKEILDLKKLNISKLEELEKEIELKNKDLKLLNETYDQIVKEEKEFKKNLIILEKDSVQVVENDNELKSLRKNLQVIESDIKKIDYSEQVHKDLQKDFNNIDEQSNKFKDLVQQKLLQNEKSKLISEYSQKLRIYKKDLELLKKEELAFKNLSQEKTDILNQYSEIKLSLEKIRKEKELNVEEIGKLKSQKEKLLKLEKDLKDYQSKIQSLEKEVQDYKDISTALGKDGIQALLIEEAIPEIEQEANDLLSRLTNNQSQIFIESLRDLKKGGTKETLDIKISDNIGLRPYEMFSGGEAFRIDFAIRIAISKLLARRAGTSLQTLIIDEGFGSQDEEGLSSIMDCIYKIQDDFEKVIIVSHLPSMKDQFPVHFMVNKTPAGSRVNVIECA